MALQTAIQAYVNEVAIYKLAIENIYWKTENWDSTLNDPQDCNWNFYIGDLVQNYASEIMDDPDVEFMF
jgi:hypothetical protein